MVMVMVLAVVVMVVKCGDGGQRCRRTYTWRGQLITIERKSDTGVGGDNLINLNNRCVVLHQFLESKGCYAKSRLESGGLSPCSSGMLCFPKAWSAHPN